MLQLYLYIYKKKNKYLFNCVNSEQENFSVKTIVNCDSPLQVMY